MSEKREEVVVDFQGEEITLEVPAGTPDADIESFLRFNKKQQRSTSEAIAAKTSEPFFGGAAQSLREEP